jgi:hypothetical protein
MPRSCNVPRAGTQSTDRRQSGLGICRQHTAARRGHGRVLKSGTSPPCSNRSITRVSSICGARARAAFRHDAPRSQRRVWRGAQHLSHVRHQPAEVELDEAALTAGGQSPRAGGRALLHTAHLQEALRLCAGHAEAIGLRQGARLLQTRGQRAQESAQRKRRTRRCRRRQTCASSSRTSLQCSISSGMSRI